MFAKQRNCVNLHFSVVKFKKELSREKNEEHEPDLDDKIRAQKERLEGKDGYLERKQEAEAFAKAAICVSRQPHRRPRPMIREAANEKEAGNTEIAQPDRPEEPQNEDTDGTQGAGQPAEPLEERSWSEGADKVEIPADEGDDDDDEYGLDDDEEWQKYQQIQIINRKKPNPKTLILNQLI